MSSALLVIDLQNDFCPPSGSLAVAGGRLLAPTINSLLSLPGFALRIASRDAHPPKHVSFASAHQDAEPMVTTYTIVNPQNASETQRTTLWPDHCVQGTSGAELISELETSRLSWIVDKGKEMGLESYSAFGPPFRSPEVGMTGLREKLRSAGVKRVFVTGLALDHCVRCSALDAAEFGFETYVVEDATNAVSRGEEVRERTKRELAERGVRFIRSDGEELRELS